MNNNITSEYVININMFKFKNNHFRITDYWHHPIDVFTGAAIGSAVALYAVSSKTFTFILYLVIIIVIFFNLIVKS